MNILKTILDILWIAVKISAALVLLVFLYGMFVGCLDYARKHRK